MNTIRHIAASAAAAVLIAGSGVLALQPLASAHDGHTHIEQLTPSERQLIRRATSRFQDVDVAIAAGYLPTEDCVAEPGAGSMGYHYVNPGLIADNVVDPTLPEILLYERGNNGKLRLLGVEYMATDSDQDLSTDLDRPDRKSVV